jgi:hypothetical protein
MANGINTRLSSDGTSIFAGTGFNTGTPPAGNGNINVPTLDMYAIAQQQFQQSQVALQAEAAVSSMSLKASMQSSLQNQMQGVELSTAKQGEEMAASTASATGAVAKTWAGMAASL